MLVGGMEMGVAVLREMLEFPFSFARFFLLLPDAYNHRAVSYTVYHDRVEAYRMRHFFAPNLQLDRHDF